MKVKIIKSKNKGRKMLNGFYLYLVSIIVAVGDTGIVQETVGLMTTAKKFTKGSVIDVNDTEWDVSIRRSEWSDKESGEQRWCNWIKFSAK